MVRQKVGVRVPLRDLSILGLVFLLFIAIGLVLAYFGGPFDTRIAAPAKGAKNLPGPMVEMGPYTVSMSTADRTNYMRTRLIFELDQEKTMDDVKRNLPNVQSVITSTLSNQNYESIRSSHGKQLLRTQLQQAVNKALPDAGVKAVYFRELLYE